MSPRPYRLGLRETAVEATRGRIIEAACELLASGGFGAFTIDTVARVADVSRMTVYNQFGSKAGLLEAIFDWVAERGDVRRLGEAAGHPDPDQVGSGGQRGAIDERCDATALQIVHRERDRSGGRQVEADRACGASG